jgi:CRISPR-associated protein Csm1
MTLQDQTNLIAYASIIHTLTNYGFGEIGQLLSKKLTDSENHFISNDAVDKILQQSEYFANGNISPNYHDAALCPPIFSTFISEYPNRFVNPSPLNAKSPYSINNPADIRSLKETIVAALESFSRHENFSQFIDDLDTFLQTYLHCFQATDSSLYDYTRQSAAFASALWQFSHRNTEDTKTKPILIIQGDFFGIQRFIFASNPEHNKKMAQILRGKSAGVTLLMELCIIRILEALELSPASLSRSAAGKFMIIASADTTTIERLETLKREIEQWFMDHFFGEFGIGLSWIRAAQEDFSTDSTAPRNVKLLMSNASKALEYAKATKFDLPDLDNALFPHYIESIAKTGKICPACDRRAVHEGEFCSVCGTFRELGSKLVLSHQDILWIYKNETDPFAPFGYSIRYHEDKTQPLVRCWNIRLPEKNGNIYHSMARRTLKAFIPHAQTFEDLAKNAEGTEGLIAIKADIDNLGLLFAERIHTYKIASFAQSSTLSRTINHFFTHKIAYLLAHTRPEFQNIYTVFAGGDDLFLIGTWNHTLDFIALLKEEFDSYFETPHTSMSFSAGMAMFKAGVPVSHIAHVSENLLETAKKAEGKNSLSLFGETVSFDKYKTLITISKEISIQAKELKLPTSYLRNLVTFGEEAQKSETDVFATKWNAQFRYNSLRNVIDKAKNEDREKASALVSKLGATINTYKGGMKIVIFPILYTMRGGKQ